MNKKILLLVFFGMLVICSFSVSATTNFTVPVANGNYSTTLNITLNTNVANATNTTCYYNSSGGAATTWLTEILNDSYQQNNFTNGSISLGGFTETATYNISCTVEGDTTETASLSSITIDSTIPSVIVSTISGVSYSTQTRANGTFILNVSITDTINATTVFFNLTNSSGAQDAIYYAAREGTGNYWVNSTGFNISKFTQGAYTITVHASDSSGNLNSSESSGTIYFDSVSPSSVTITESSHSSTSLSLIITIVDATSGIASSCTADRSGASISGTGLSQTLTESSLSCGNSYSYVVTCTDRAGNSGASSSTSFSTTGCSPALGSSSSTQNQWTHTYVIQNSEFEAGYSKELGSNQRMRVSVGTQSHYVGVKSLSASSATIEVSSDPVTVILDIGGDAKLDVTDDGFYDIYVKLLGISNNKADISVQKIYEEIPAGEGPVATTGEEVTSSSGTTTTTGGITEDEGGSLTWLWWVIGIIVVLVIAGVVINRQRK